MLKVLRTPLKQFVTMHEEGEEIVVEESPVVEYSVSENELQVELGFTVYWDNNNREDTTSYSRTLSKTDYMGKALQINLDDGNETKELIVMRIFDFADRYTGLVHSNASAGALPLVRIVFDDQTGDVIVMLLVRSNEIEGFENYETDPKLTRTGNMRKYSPMLVELTDRRLQKSLLLNEVDYYDSLSYLEAQVDLLTKVVMELMPDAESECYQLLMAADEYSVINIKPVEKIRKAFNEKKKRFRYLQDQYYGHS